MNGVHTNGPTGVAANGRGSPKRRSAPVGANAPGDAALRAELAALRREQKELRDAFSEAAQVHRKLCAPRQARRGSFEIASEMFPVRHLSGDFFKVFDLRSRTGLVLGDIAGKGLSAGLWVPYLLGLIRLFTNEQADLAQAVEAINRQLFPIRHGEPEAPMVALFLARLDARAGELEYCNAGQPAALLVRSAAAHDAVGLLQEGGPVLGALGDAAYRCGRVRLTPGDTLVACSDGAVESRRASRRDPGEEEFGLQRLTAAVRLATGRSAAQLLFSTLGAVLDFAGGRPLEDDLTLMVVRRLP